MFSYQLFVILFCIQDFASKFKSDSALYVFLLCQSRKLPFDYQKCVLHVVKIFNEHLGTETRQVKLGWERVSSVPYKRQEKTSPGPKGTAGGNTESPTTFSPAVVLTLWVGRIYQ